MRMFRALFVFFALVLFITEGYTQEVGKQVDDKQTTPSRYVFGKDRELLMSVNILGAAEKSGQYMVPSETDFVGAARFCRRIAARCQIERRQNRAPDQWSDKTPNHKNRFEEALRDERRCAVATVDAGRPCYCRQEESRDFASYRGYFQKRCICSANNIYHLFDFERLAYRWSEPNSNITFCHSTQICNGGHRSVLECAGLARVRNYRH